MSAKKEVHRLVASRKLSDDEVSEARRLRDLAEKDKEEIFAAGRGLIAEKLRRRSAAGGTTTLGKLIRDAREARGLTQADLADRARVAQAYLSYLEQDQREPSLAIAARIARELEIPLDELASAVADAS
jgi:ribosome-binding protein aMBF1 (putative translation factor)